MKKNVKREADSRINASIISLRLYIAVFLVIFVIMAGQAVIMLELNDKSTKIVWILIYYFLVTGLIVTIFFGVSRKYLMGMTINRLAEAAREISQGNYEVKVETLRKDGKVDEIDVLIEDFNLMAKQLKSVETLKSDFIANVSHEIKSPLAVIQTYAMALKDPSITKAEQEEFAKTIIHATQKLTLMVSNILKLNKLENQETKPVPARYQLGEQIRRIALDHIKVWQENNIEFSIFKEDIIINYDESLLDLVWNNLISNAIKFTKPGGKIEISTATDTKYVYVTIKDSGEGISQEHLERIFDKFYQGDLSRSTEGNGLGLALVKKVLEIVGGEISVTSEINVGSSFTVKLKKDA